MKPVKLLVFIAVGSAIIAGACIGAAYALARGHDSGSTEIISRDIAWDGSTRAILDVPAKMRYVQAPGPARLLARGPHRSISTLTVTDGHIHDLLLRTGAALEITLAAPDVSSFSINGDSRLVIEAYDQPTLTLSTEGSSQIEASGSVRDLTVDADGYSVINLARLKADAVTADVGSASILIAAPTSRARFEASGFGTAILLSRPADLVTDTAGEGLVIDASPAPRPAQ